MAFHGRPHVAHCRPTPSAPAFTTLTNEGTLKAMKIMQLMQKYTTDGILPEYAFREFAECFLDHLHEQDEEHRLELRATILDKAAEEVADLLGTAARRRQFWNIYDTHLKRVRKMYGDTFSPLE